MGHVPEPSDVKHASEIHGTKRRTLVPRSRHQGVYVQFYKFLRLGKAGYAAQAGRQDERVGQFLKPPTLGNWAYNLILFILHLCQVNCQVFCPCVGTVDFSAGFLGFMGLIREKTQRKP